MSRGFPQRKPSRSPQIGDMRDRIEIYSRRIGVPNFGDTSFDQTHTLIETLWATVQTFQGNKTFTGNNVFDGVDIEAKIVEQFVIRYRDDIVVSNIIKFNGNVYKIELVDNADFRKRFLYLYTSLLGEDGLEVNQ